MCSDVGAFCYILTWKCASHHNSLHFLNISTSKSGLRRHFVYTFDLEMCFPPQRRAIFHLSSGQMAPHPPRFSEPTFRPSGATNHWTKHSEARLFYLFPYLHLLSSDSFSSLILSLLFSSLTLPTSAFPSVHIVGSLTSKLPSIILRVQAGLEKLYMCGHPVLSLNLAQFPTLWSFVAREETDKNCKVHPTFA